MAPAACRAGLPGALLPPAQTSTAPPLFSASLCWAAAFAPSATTAASAEASAVVSNYTESKVESNIAAFQADKSRLALRPDDWGLMRGLMSSSNAALERRVPHNTKKQDRCYWRMWSEFCALLNTPPIRDDVEAATGANTVLHARELQLVEACFMYWVFLNPKFLVTSMLARLRGVARIHKVSLRLPFVPLSYLVQVCKGLVLERIDEQGPSP